MHPPLWMHGIIVTPPAGATGKPKPHRSPRNGCADLACPKHVERTRAGRTFATNMLFPRYPKQPQYPRFPQRLKRPLQSRQLNNRLNPQNPHCGIWPASSSDKPTEQDRPKRDRPRLVFQPIHAVIAILTLSCALCASLTCSSNRPSTTVRSNNRRSPNPNNRRRTEPRKTRRRPRKQHQPAAIHGTRQPERTNIRTSGARRSG